MIVRRVDGRGRATALIRTWGVGLTGALLAWPDLAWAESGAAGTAETVLLASPIVMIVLGAAAAVCAAATAVLWLARRQAAPRLRGLTAAIGAATAELDGVACWAAEDDRLLYSTLAATPARLQDIAEILARNFETPPEIEAALAAFRKTGARFETDLVRRDGTGRFRLAARRVTVAGKTTNVVWLRDESRLVGEIDGLRAENWNQKAHAAVLEVLLDRLPLPVWVRDENLTLVAVNKAYAALFDREPGTCLAEAIEIGAGVIDKEGLGLARRARSTGKPQSESHHVVFGGQRRLFDFTEFPSPDGSMIGVAFDHTALESLQDQLSSHIGAHAEVLEQLSTAIVVYGPDKRVRFFNKAYVELTQLDRRFLESEPIFEEVYDALRERRMLPEYADFSAFKRSRAQLFRSLIDRHEELSYLPNGQTLRVVATPHPFGGLMFSFEDVTDRMSLEQSYNTLIAVQRASLDNLYEGIAVYGSDGRLKLHNPVFARMWLLSDQDLAGDPHISVVIEKTRNLYSTPGDWEETRRREIARVTDPKPHTGRMERADGSVLDYAVVPLPDGNVMLSYLDVTDSVRVEQALLDRNEALETADRLKSEFIANVSYELRTPLNTIIGFAEILANEYFGRLNQRQSEYSQGLLTASQQLMSLINDILDLATIEAGHMVLDLDRVPVRAIVDHVITLTRERAREHNLVLHANCPVDAGDVVCDERRIKQALFNLLSNAIKYTLADGKVEVAAGRTDREVWFSVSDTGIGIPEEDQDRVFEKFERGRGSAVRPTGTGLGLSLVRKLIELHEGRVEMRSAPGQGTTVTCYLPVRSIAAPTPVSGLGAEVGARAH